MSIISPEKIPCIAELKPKENCKFCGGRGTLTEIHPSLDATKFYLIVPCTCVKKVYKLRLPKDG